MAYAFYLGIDAHTTDDGAGSYALALVEKEGSNGEANYRLHELRRLGGKPGDVAEQVQNMISQDPYVGRTICVANDTDKMGKAVHRALNDRGLAPIGVQLSGGDAATQTGGASGFSGVEETGDGDPGLLVSEHVVVTGLEQVYHDGRIDLSSVQSDEPSALVKGLDQYRQEAPEPDLEGLEHIRSEPARDKENADLVLATGVACWLADQHSFDPTEHLSGQAPTTGEAKRMLRPDTN